MKKMLVTLSLMLASTSAIAAPPYVYPAGSTSLLNTLLRYECALPELQKLMNETDSNSVFTAEEQSQYSPSDKTVVYTTTLTVGFHYPAPAFGMEQRGALTIKRVPVKMDVMPMDAPTPMIVTCEVSKAK